MKTYDVTIKLTLVDMAHRIDERDVLRHVQRSGSKLLEDLAGSAANYAATVTSIVVVDRETLPRQA